MPAISKMNARTNSQLRRLQKVKNKRGAAGSRQRPFLRYSELLFICFQGFNLFFKVFNFLFIGIGVLGTGIRAK